MRPPRLLVVAAAAALLAGTAGSAALFPSAAVAGDTGPSLTIKETPKRAIYHDDIGPDVGDVVRHTGRLTGSDGAPVSGATVTLQRRLAGEAEWSTIADDTTDDDGRYTIRTDVAGNASYKVVHDDEVSPVESGEVTLEAMRDFNAVLVEKKRTAVLKGNINPGWDGKVVRWERKTCKSCSWHVVDRAEAGDNGAWRFAGKYPPIGDTWYYRATLHGTEDFVDSVSAMLITDRVQGRRPALG
jgi:hypothetical protein